MTEDDGRGTDVPDAGGCDAGECDADGFDASGCDAGGFDTGGYVRRLRRVAGLSQRAMADLTDMTQQTLARVETARQDLRVREFAALVRTAGLRLVLVDGSGAEVAPMQPDTVRDAGGRRFPAHVDVRHGDDDWWHGPHRYTREQPTYTFSLGRELQAGDHPAPSPEDDLRWRRERREHEARVARARRAQWARVDRTLRQLTGDLAPEPEVQDLCTCPPGCEALLVGDDPAGQLDPHVEDCPCRCDVH